MAHNNCRKELNAVRVYVTIHLASDTISKKVRTLKSMGNFENKTMALQIRQN